MEDDSTAAVIASWKDNVIEFVTAKLEKYQPRDNYCDLLELSIYISGWGPASDILEQFTVLAGWPWPCIPLRLAVSQPVGTTPAWIIRITEVSRSRSIIHQ